MTRKNATLSKRRSKPSLKVATGQNGHANSKMNNIEMRKRDTPSSESSADRATRLMSHPGFSLDSEPVVPPTPVMTTTSFQNLPANDRRNFLLLVLLYFLQGVPMGLATGSVPFLLKPHLSYGQIGVFSLASYPYSLKLFWSPIVDAVWSPRFGRRKSWITPVQVVAGLAMIYLGGRIEPMMTQAGANGGAGVWNFTYWWFGLVFFCATQDIAVDGWAITLMSQPNISYASTAQTVGLTAGHFLSYTVFLAFNSKDFANRWFRTIPGEGGLLSLGTYLTFWGWAYLLVTLGLALLKKEDHTKERDSILDVYKSMWSVLKLKNIQTIIIIHLIAKIGFQANDGVTSLKLLDKGFGQDNMALVVLIDFPFEIMLGYYAGKWSTEYTPMRLWGWAFVGRLAAAVLAQLTVMIFPSGTDVPFWYLMTVIMEHIISTFMNTVMFVAISAFHARIADPAIGGTYMTLLATVCNLGGTFPRYFILKLVDMFTEATCLPPTVPIPPSQLKDALVTTAFSCALEPEKNRCVNGGGTCQVGRDGYYLTNILCVAIGTVTFVMFIKPAATRLQNLPLRAWRLMPTNERD
ncbi:Major facilitator superfamily domain general substrate transporter [Penicillium alfredii]|uniref:Major facilitator superfamily domain general substrate transporter n=1 Tax=Penicillium alfredii TaxID=1506179 RepID=A0A9W9KR56_9EURO|nr:Major facilitator superfamily domain general substrate transporter [Penicillium alfredii]KAJ5114826.1 Major facilitator superfamily domain general substrate transporter [Penicillium alfredii]